MVEPGRNSITSPNSQRTRWPPLVGLNLPRAVTEHRPNARLAKSLCGKQTMLGCGGGKNT